MRRDTATVATAAAGAATRVGVSSASVPGAPAAKPTATAPTAVTVPTTIPVTAPAAVVPRHQMDSTITGVSADPASANAHETIAAITDGNSAVRERGSSRSAGGTEASATTATATRPARTACRAVARGFMCRS